METRAKELIEMIASPVILPLAIKYASKLGRIHLAEKLNELLPQFDEQEKARNQYDETDAASDLLLSTPIASQNLITANKDKYASPSITPVIQAKFMHHAVFPEVNSYILFAATIVDQSAEKKSIQENTKRAKSNK